MSAVARANHDLIASGGVHQTVFVDKTAAVLVRHIGCGVKAGDVGFGVVFADVGNYSTVGKAAGRVGIAAVLGQVKAPDPATEIGGVEDIGIAVVVGIHRNNVGDDGAGHVGQVEVGASVGGLPQEFASLVVNHVYGVAHAVLGALVVIVFGFVIATAKK